MDHFRVVFQGDGKQAILHRGATLLEAAGQAGIILNTPCGGKGICGKCAVTLEPAGQTVRACQYVVTGDLTVTVPPESRFYRHQILQDGLQRPGSVPLSVGRRYLAVTGARPIFGLAIDIGTTTVVAKLFDMLDGRHVATEAALNPQTRFGDDVVSRISYAQSEAQANDLNRVIIEELNDLIARLCRTAGISSSALYEACIVGNTTMTHLLLRFPVEQLGRAPYEAHSLEAQDVPPAGLGLDMNPQGNVHCVENIAGFLGADTTAAALAVDMDRVVDMALLVDIGTNGELVLGTPEGLHAVSCAAGPALEGARISQGGRACEGAIEAVVIDNGDLGLDVIGGVAPRSICGSGLIDAVAVMRDLGIIDGTGRFAPADALDPALPDAIGVRVIEQEGQPAFCLAWDSQASGPAVALTQNDIREVQLAKGAIRAGIELLLRKVDMGEARIDRLLLAGAFGNYIRPQSAVRIGLLPSVPLDRVHFVGNAAASGAELLLLSDEWRRRAGTLARHIRYVETARDPGFAEVFAKAMHLDP
jgi:uncharacterized 2Fe-2S/4Fe-4S cluster protein (DUF4445 family)